MNLVADFGNTACKYYFYNKNRLIGVYYGIGEDQRPHIDHIIKWHGPFERGILSSVVNNNYLAKRLTEETKLLILKPGVTPIPVNMGYKTPLSLGPDRVATAVGGYTLFPTSPVLTIDAGTCIKYDLVVDTTYIGGIIAPGLMMQAKALHTFTGKLPFINSLPTDTPPLTGTDTFGSMLSGIINVTVSSMNGIIAKYHKEYSGLKVILTGGDMHFFDKRLKYSIFAHPNLTGLGLNKILNFNEKRD